MNSRLQLFWQIRQESRVDGVPAALQTARTAVADGRMALTDVSARASKKGAILPIWRALRRQRRSGRSGGDSAPPSKRQPFSTPSAVFLALRHGDWQRLLPVEVAKVAANDGGARAAA
jgi:hypothetical protein